MLIGRLTADPTTHAGEKHESATFRLAVPRAGNDAAEFIAPASSLFRKGPCDAQHAFEFFVELVSQLSGLAA